jgi:DNA-binding beta-propeller fold protein YncE
VNGPWGMAVNDRGAGAQLFVSNVLDGTITRLNISFRGGNVSVVGTPTTIASGYAFAPDDAGLVVGPAGLFYDSSTDRLYVAAEGDNQIYVIKNASSTGNAGKGKLVFSDSHLEGPLGLIIGPNGNLITANADPAAFQNPNTPSELVEFTKSGQFVREFSIDPNLGAAFAVLNVPVDDINEFSYVDDVTALITILRVPQ